MARRGRFGRLPRSAPSLTSTIVAIARQMEQQTDQNMMDAWQKGGTVDGSPVTDERVLAYWRTRLAGVDKADPLHDTYKNTIEQLDYTIHESKMTAKFAEHKATDAQMISFYLGWAKKVPKNSEFYRVLQRDAGQYMRTSRASGAASAARAKEARYQQLQADTRKGKEAAGEYMINTLRRIAQSGYADGGITALIGAPGSGSDLTDFDPSDPQQMLRLLDVITQGTGIRGHGPQVGNQDVVYHDDHGKGITGEAIINSLTKLDPSWKPGMPIDTGYITGLLDRQIAGLQERMDRARATGHVSDLNALTKSMAYVATLNREVAAWPIEKAYQSARTTFDKVANDPTASPQAVLNAWQTYSAELTSLANDPKIAADDNLRSRLVGEAEGSAAAPTLAESFTGLQTGAFDAQSAKDSANTAAHVAFLQQQVEAVQAGNAIWTYGTTNSNGVFVPTAGGREIGAATQQQVEAGGANVASITVADPAGGVPLQMLVTAVPVYASAIDPLTGQPLQRTNSFPVAYAYDLPKGGSVQTVYGFQTKDGFVYSVDPPWGDKVNVSASSSGGNHLELTLTAPVGADLSKDGDLGNGWSVRGATDANGQPRAGGGTLIYDPQAATYATSDRNATGAPDPTSDFHSLTLASLMDDADGRAILGNLDKNPAFKQQLTNDAYQYSGATWDPATLSWVPGTGDANKLASATFQTNLVQNATSLDDWIAKAAQGWQKLTTGSPFPANSQPTVPGTQGVMTLPDGLTQLASQLVHGTDFAVLGAAFTPGTNQIDTSRRFVKDDLVIQSPTSLKVPSIAPASLPPVAPTAVAPASYVPPSPVQTGSIAPTFSGSGGTSGGTGSLPPSGTNSNPNRL